MSYLRWVFCGWSANTRVIFCATPPSVVIVSPMGLALPKYLWANVSLTAMVPCSFSAVFGSP